MGERKRVSDPLGHFIMSAMNNVRLEASFAALVVSVSIGMVFFGAAFLFHYRRANALRILS